MWIALLTSLLIMLFALGMERVEAALPHRAAQPADGPAPDSAVPELAVPTVAVAGVAGPDVELADAALLPSAA